MNYTLTPHEVGRLVKARALQVARFREACLKETGRPPQPGNPLANPGTVNVSFVNGTTTQAQLPLWLLKQWSGTFGKAERITVNTEQLPHFLILRHGTSSLRINGSTEETLVPAIPLVAPENGGAFVADLTPQAETELTALRKQAKDEKGRQATAKKLREVRTIERQDMAKLREAAKEVTAAKKLLAKTTLTEAVGFARRCLAARRMARALWGDPGEWRGEVMPESYQSGAYSGPDGNLITDTENTRSHFDTWLAAIAQAQSVIDAYKPPMRRCKWNPAEKKPVYGPKWHGLVEVREEAKKSLCRFVIARFREWLVAHGLPHELAEQPRDKWEVWQHSAFDPARETSHRVYSRARNTVRTWPAAKARLASAYLEAIKERKSAYPTP